MSTDILGTLVVVVLKARNLNDKHTFHKQDVFAQVALSGVQKRTVVDIKGGQHPVWDEEIRISVQRDSSEKHRILEVSCWSKEPRIDDLLGQGKVDITETLRSGEFDGTGDDTSMVWPLSESNIEFLDWVKLETDGGYRGDVFLEMTFYANAPAPLKRRPTKLDPNTRLSRPTQPYKYPNTSPASPLNPNKSSPGRDSNQLPPKSAKQNYLAPPSSRSPSSSPKRRDDALPSLSEARAQLPTSLAAGVGPSANAAMRKPELPAMLRPGNLKSPQASLEPSHPSSPNGDRQSQNHSEYPWPAPRPQTSGLPNPYAASGSSTPTSAPPRTQTASQPKSYDIMPAISFPVASMVNAHNPSYEPQYTNYTSQPLAYQPPTSTAASSDLPDPYLSARYQQPLPLPSNAGPPPQLPARRDPAAEAAEIRRQVVLQEEQQRLKRKEQEDADAALARQLDLELNVGDTDRRGRSDEIRMPGSW